MDKPPIYLIYFVYKYFTFVTKMSRNIFSFETKASVVQDSHYGTFLEYYTYQRFVAAVIARMYPKWTQ